MEHLMNLCDKESCSPTISSKLPSTCVTTRKVADDDERLINHLSIDVAKETLLYWDIHSQIVAKRVCFLWNKVLSTYNTSECVTIDFNSNNISSVQQPTQNYNYGFVLHRAVNSATKMLSLINLRHHAANSFVVVALLDITVTVLAMNNIYLSVLLVKHCDVTVSRPLFTVYGCDNWINTCFRNTAVRHSSLLPLRMIKVCRQLLISRYTVHFEVNFDKKTFPDYAEDRMPGFVGSSAPSHLNLEIPHLSFDSEESTEERAYRFLHTLDERCPPVDIVTREHLRKLHSGWARKIPYPGKNWEVFKQHLDYYQTRKPAAPAVYWNVPDLRNFESLSFLETSV
ncbi:uncharacterized protein LOC129597495 [Paramacrobiotus metropolitanus]|uniref:uncharacterized protein LOC129597495 n=1 Tax=Paramacrobiotus metropolitanus TaxID=2943436 RepID=UPI002445A012|nr:uncharacterized protein LOC129597495 [Paramacrobiotus metropolitanus]